MRRFGFLLAVLVLVIFLSALFSKPSVVNRGTAQRMEHYPTVGIGDIFRGTSQASGDRQPRSLPPVRQRSCAPQWSMAPLAPRPVWPRTYWSAKAALSAMARLVRSRRETPYATRNANGMENSAGWV